MIRGGTVSVSPGAPTTITPPPGAVTGVQLVNTSYYVLEVGAGGGVSLCGSLSTAVVELPAQGVDVTLTQIAGAASGPGSVVVYWLEATDQPLPAGSLGPNPTAYVSVGTIAAGQTSATVSPPPGTTALVINGVAGTSTLSAAGSPSGIALALGESGGQWVASLPGGPGDTAYTVTLSASQATAVNIWSTANQAVVINLQASGGSGGMNNPMTTYGDMIEGAASGTPTRLASPTSGSFPQFLQVASAGALPGYGAAPSSGLTLIQAVTLAAAAANITFSAIVATFSHLYIVARLRSVDAAESDSFGVQFDGDTGTNYETIAYGSASTNGTYGEFPIGTVPAANATAGNFAQFDMLVANYASTTMSKTATGYLAWLDLQTNAADYGYFQFLGRYRGTAAVASVKLFLTTGYNLATGSEASLYGVA